MDIPLDVLIVTAADGEDTAAKGVDEGALIPWEETDGPEGYGFKVWFREDREPVLPPRGGHS